MLRVTRVEAVLAAPALMATDMTAGPVPDVFVVSINRGLVSTVPWVLTGFAGPTAIWMILAGISMDWRPSEIRMTRPVRTGAFASAFSVTDLVVAETGPKVIVTSPTGCPFCRTRADEIRSKLV